MLPIKTNSLFLLVSFAFPTITITITMLLLANKILDRWKKRL